MSKFWTRKNFSIFMVLFLMTPIIPHHGVRNAENMSPNIYAYQRKNMPLARNPRVARQSVPCQSASEAVYKVREVPHQMLLKMGFGNGSVLSDAEGERIRGR